MNDPFGCGDLADLVGGALQLAVMPPLGGRHEPVGHVVTRRDHVVPGCLYWATAPGREAERHVQEALLRGARGVVVGRSAVPRPCPFDGGFVISVDDARAALWSYARWRRACHEGALMLAGPAAPAQRIAKAWEASQAAGAAAPRAAAVIAFADADAAAAALATIDDAGIWILQATASIFSEIAEISHLCSPDVVCIYSLTRGERRPDRRPGEDRGGINRAAAVPWAMIDVDHHKVTLDGRELVAREVGDGRFDLSGLSACVTRDRLPAGLACWAVSEAIANAAESCGQGRQRHAATPETKNALG